MLYQCYHISIFFFIPTLKYNKDEKPNRVSFSFISFHLFNSFREEFYSETSVSYFTDLCANLLPFLSEPWVILGSHLYLIFLLSFLLSLVHALDVPRKKQGRYNLLTSNTLINVHISRWSRDVFLNGGDQASERTHPFHALLGAPQTVTRTSDLWRGVGQGDLLPAAGRGG